MGTAFVKRDIPELVGWETTLRCNMRCKHCGSTAGDARDVEMDTQQAMGLCKQIIDMGVRRVCLTGGETLLRRDWQAIVDKFLANNVEVGLLTNGWTLTDSTLKSMERYGKSAFYVSVSLDGTPEVHDTIRDLPGSFDRAFQGAKGLKSMGIPAAVITTVSRANIHCLPQLRNMLLTDMKPYAWQVQVTNTFGRARENDQCTVGPVEYVKAVLFVAETRRMVQGTETKIAAGDCMGYLSSHELSIRDAPWMGCGAGLALVGIQSNGNLKGCLSIIDDRMIEGNVLTDGLANLWNKPGAFAYTRQFNTRQLKGMCTGCSVGEQCRGGCTAGAMSAFGEPHHAPHCMRIFEQLVEQEQKDGSQGADAPPA